MKRKKLLIGLTLTIILLFSVSHVIAEDFPPIYTPDQPLDSYNEAPVLSEQVEQGEIPAVEKRLPNNPPIVKVKEKIGEYGGAWNLRAPSASFDPWYWIGQESLLVMAPNGKVYPSLARDWEWNDDLTELTLYLREGVKWSDGNSFNAEDIMFWWYDYMNYGEDVNLPEMTQPDGKPMKMEKLDNYTIKMTFATSNPLFINWLANNIGFGLIPKHALEEFHPDYTDKSFDNPDDLMAELTERVEEELQYPEIPTLKPWIVDKQTAGDRIIFKRNPYYWKIDVEGNQLPYLNELVIHEVQDSEVFHINLSQGKYDLQTQSVSTTQLPMLWNQKEKGNYEVYLVPNGSGPLEVALNWHTSNEKLRDLIQTRDFRIALSHALDREKIIDLAWDGLATLGQAFIGPINPYCDEDVEEWRMRYTEYDPEKTNKMLDELGLEKGSDGWRKYSNGETIEIVFTTLPEIEEVATMTQLVKEMWAEVGIKVHINNQERGVYVSKVFGDADYEGTIIWTGATTMKPFMYGRLFAMGAGALWAPRYNPNHSSYIEPPEEVKKLHELWRKGTFDAETHEERAAIIKEALKLHAENLYEIGIGINMKEPAVKRNDFHNVPVEELIASGRIGRIDQLRPEQFFTTKE